MFRFNEEFYAFIVRPDAIKVWTHKEVRNRLEWYYLVMSKKKPSKYRIVKTIPIPRDVKDISKLDSEILWSLHYELSKQFKDRWGKIKDGQEKLSEYDRPSSSFLDLKIELVNRLLSPCILCEHRCKIDRLGGRRGFCGLDSTVRVSSAFLHLGEEAPLVPSGTIFFSGCSFKCVFCVDEEEFVLSRVNGRIMVLKMKVLNELFNFSNIEVFTPNGWRRVSNIFNRISDVIYEVETYSGRKIRLTPEHLVICEDDGKYDERPVFDLKRGDRLVIFGERKKYGNFKGQIVSKINLIEEFMNTLPKNLIAKIWVGGIKSHLMNILDEKNFRYFDFIEGYGLKEVSSSMIGKDRIPLSLFVRLCELLPKLENSIEDYFLFMDEGDSYFPSVLLITPSLMRFLGYFMSVGRYGPNFEIVLTIKNRRRLDGVLLDVKKAISEFIVGGEYRYYSDGLRIIISNRFLYLFFKYVLGISDDKSFPWILFNVSDNLVKEFLSAYLLLGGTEIVDKNDGEYARIIVFSDDIKNGFIYLLSMYGFQIKVREIDSLKNVSGDLPYPIYLLDMMSKHDLKIKKIELIKFDGGALNDQIEIDYVENICKVFGRRTVYDIVIDGRDDSISEHTFYAGDGILIHNCQNWDISSTPFSGSVVSAEDLAGIARKLAIKGARNINYVGGNPDQNLHLILESFRHLDVNIPILWNSNMYISKEGLLLLNDVVDIWLPDFKYGNNECAFRYSRIKNYFDIISRNHKTVYDYGDNIIIRHLIMPNHFDCCTKEILGWISRNTPNVMVNLMDQYRPDHRVLREPERFKDINRRLSRKEVEKAFELAKSLDICYEYVS